MNPVHLFLPCFLDPSYPLLILLQAVSCCQEIEIEIEIETITVVLVRKELWP
jgi:hypothetical protein